MKIKYKIILVILGILLISSLVLGTSYAMWTFTAVQENTNVVSTDCFDITLSDFNNITLNNAMPISDSDAMSLIPYTFTIKNICNHAANYDVNIETLSGSTLDINYLRYKLDNKDSNILGNEQDVSSSNFVNDNAIKSNTIFSNILESNEEKTFNLRLWIDEAATVDETASKYYSSKVVVRASLNAHYSSTTLISGMEFNAAIKQLANPDISDITNFTYDKKIKHIDFADSMPDESVEKVSVSESDDKPVYAWFDNDTIYLYSDSEKIYLNSDSSYLFCNFGAIESLDISLFDTSKVTNMKGMFRTNLAKILDLSTFKTSNVTDMSYMFTDMRSIQTLDLSSFDTSNVTNMSYMFQYNSAQTLNLSSFDTSNVTNMYEMFSYMSSLQTLDLSSFDTSNVTDMGSMFTNDSSLQTIDLSSFDTSNVTYIGFMFLNCNNLETIYAGDKWNTSKTNRYQTVFSDDLKLVGGQGTKFSETIAEYARIDDPDNGKPGYFTLKNN